MSAASDIKALETVLSGVFEKAAQPGVTIRFNVQPTRHGFTLRVGAFTSPTGTTPFRTWELDDKDTMLGVEWARGNLKKLPAAIVKVQEEIKITVSQ